MKLRATATARSWCPTASSRRAIASCRIFGQTTPCSSELGRNCSSRAARRQDRWSPPDAAAQASSTRARSAKVRLCPLPNAMALRRSRSAAAVSIAQNETSPEAVRAVAPAFVCQIDSSGSSSARPTSTSRALLEPPGQGEGEGQASARPPQDRRVAHRSRLAHGGLERLDHPGRIHAVTQVGPADEEGDRRLLAGGPGIRRARVGGARPRSPRRSGRARRAGRGGRAPACARSARRGRGRRPSRGGRDPAPPCARP